MLLWTAVCVQGLVLRHVLEDEHQKLWTGGRKGRNRTKNDSWVLGSAVMAAFVRTGRTVPSALQTSGSTLLCRTVLRRYQLWNCPRKGPEQPFNNACIGGLRALVSIVLQLLPDLNRKRAADGPRPRPAATWSGAARELRTIFTV